jgi:hypothetical protein
VYLSRAALVQIMRYALTHYDEINSAMLNPLVTRSERTRSSYAKMIASPGEWGVSPDLYRLSEFATLISGPMSAAREVPKETSFTHIYGYTTSLYAFI